MPYTSCYIDLYNNQLLTNQVDYAGNLTSVGVSNIDNPYAYKPVSNRHTYSAFLHNPITSNKILKIKNFEFKYTTAGYTSPYTNIVIKRASGLSTGSIEPYIKLSSTAPDLPSDVGLTLNPLTSHTDSGSFRIRPSLISRAFSQQFVPQHLRYNNDTYYEGQRINSTNIQDITLNANQHIMIAYGSTAYVNTKFEINLTFISGSNTYFQTATTSTTNFPVMGGSNLYDRYPAAIVNNSNTAIKIQKISITPLYNDAGYYSPGFGQNGTFSSKQLLVEHVTKDRIPYTISDELINGDTHDIIELDSTNSIPNNIKCYKSCVPVFPYPQYVVGDSITQPLMPLYVRTPRLLFGNFLVGVNPNAAAVPGVGLINLQLNGSINTRYDHHRNTEIILNPGEGLGFINHANGSQQDNADGAQFGHITFTVEDIPVTETGFGY